VWLWAIQPALNARNSPRAVAEAAGSATPRGATIGLFRNDPLIGPLQYYGGRRVHPLEDAEEVTRFFAQGGRVLVVEDEDLALLGDESSFRVLARERIRQRLMLVIGPAS
jgi:hypothetical protein